MSKLLNQQFQYQKIEDFSTKNTAVHHWAASLKIIAVLVYLVVLTSFHKWELIKLMPMALLAYAWLLFGEIPLKPLLKRLLLVEPLLIGVGLLNPIFEQTRLVLGPLSLSTGWITLFNLVFKGSLSVLIIFALISTTSIPALGQGLRRMGLPKVFITQLLLTYRYISILMEEIVAMTTAYHLRAPRQTGVALKDMGSFAGQLLLRTIARSERIYAAMKVRGFSGVYPSGKTLKPKSEEWLFLLLWTTLLVVIRLIHI